MGLFYRVFLNLIFTFKCIRKIKSPYNPVSGARVRRGFDHLTCPNVEVFDHLFGQIPTQCFRGIVGLTIDRCILQEVTCFLKYWTSPFEAFLQ